jgi:hypothetical protein
MLEHVKPPSFKRFRILLLAGLLPAAIFITLAPPPTLAQQSLPAPDAKTDKADIIGLVTDTDGALVSNAQITFTSGTHKRSVLSDSAGRFSLTGVPAGKFHLSVSATGLEPTSTSATSTPGEVLELPPIKLPVATANTEVNVNLTTKELAQSDVEEEEKQRALGIFPNFLVSYNRTFTPLDAKQKLSLGLHVTLDPTHFIFAAAAAGIQTADNQYPGYGQDFAGFGQRYGAVLATTTTSTLLRAAVFPAIFHQDPRYFYRGTGTKTSRALYALSTAFISKGDNGQWQPAYSTLAASFTSGALSRFYYAPVDRKGASLIVENSFLSLGGVAVGHLLQEFLFARITKHGKHLPPPASPPPTPSTASQIHPTPDVPTPNVPTPPIPTPPMPTPPMPTPPMPTPPMPTPPMPSF